MILYLGFKFSECKFLMSPGAGVKDVTPITFGHNAR